MPTHVGLGFSSDHDAHQAGLAATRQALAALGRREPEIVVVSATPDLEARRLLAAIHSLAGGAFVVGACTPGVIYGGATARKGVGVLAVSSDELVFSAGHVGPLHGTLVRRRDGWWGHFSRCHPRETGQPWGCFWKRPERGHNHSSP